MPTAKQLEKEKKMLEQRLANMFSDLNFDDDWLERHDLGWESSIGWRVWYEPLSWVWASMVADDSKPLPGLLCDIVKMKNSEDPSYQEAVSILKNLYHSFLESKQ